MRALIKGGTIITPIQTLTDSVVIIEDGLVSAVEPIRQESSNPAETEIISADGLFVMPGLIDIHVHGGAGCDTMDATSSALENMSSFFIRHGVTAFLPTTVSQTSENISQAILNIQRNMSCCSGAVPLGVHLEGPYLCEPYRGAHQVEFLHNPEPGEYRRWLDSGVVRLMTLAPELPGALGLIREGVASGVRFSAGHTQASAEEVKSAIGAGLRHATHTFNGMAGLHHRDLGTTGALLADDRVICEIIADGVHVHPDVLKMVIRIKGLENTLLITDAMRAAGLTDGEFDLGGQSIHVSAGVARTRSGGLAGSTLTLDQAVRNIQKFAGLPLHKAVQLATFNPAVALGLRGKKGEIKVGADADILIADSEMNIKTIIINGKIINRLDD